MADTIPATIPPAELRREADRRELIERHQAVMRRCAARNEIVDVLMELSSSTVRAAGPGAADALKDAVKKLYLLDQEDRERGTATNGEVTALGHDGWWQARDAHVHDVAGHEIFRRLKAGNYTGPSW